MTRARPMLASDQVRILLTLVPFLVERGEVSIDDAAREFDVTAAQMRRMIERLTLVGLPGEDGYYQMPHEMFDIDWDLLDERDVILIRERVELERAPRLSTREAAALLAGLQIARSIPGLSDTDAWQTIAEKLARGTSGRPADVVVATSASPHTLREVSRAVAERRAVRFTYRPPDREATTRTVDPEVLTNNDAQWYLRGWCHLRRAMRTFHLDRMSDVVVTETPVSHTAGAGDMPSDPADETRVTVRYRPEHAAALGEFLRGCDIRTEDGWTVADIRVADPRSLTRSVTRAGGLVEVLAPEIARDAVASWTAAALENTPEA